MESPISSLKPASFVTAALFAVGVSSTLTIWLPMDWVSVFMQTAFFLTAILATPAIMPLSILGLLPLWGLAQLFAQASAVPSMTLRAVLYWSALAAIYCAAYSVLARSSVRRGFLKACATFAVTLCTVSLLQFFTSEGRHFWVWKGAEPQIFGPFQSRNNFATFAVLMTPLVLWKAIEKRETSWAWLSGAALMVGAVAASGSRAGAALMLVELVVYAILVWRKLSLSVILGGVTVIGLGIGVAGWTHLARKLDDSDPWRYRREMIGSAISMAKDRPLLGHGLGTYPAVYPAYASFDSGHRVNHAHNDWAEWAAEGGWPFFTLLAALALSTFPAAFRHPWALGLPFVCAHALVDYPFQRLGVAFWFVVLAAAVRQESATFGTARKASNDG